MASRDDKDVEILEPHSLEETRYIMVVHQRNKQMVSDQIECDLSHNSMNVRKCWPIVALRCLAPAGINSLFPSDK